MIEQVKGIAIAMSFGCTACLSSRYAIRAMALPDVDTMRIIWKVSMLAFWSVLGILYGIHLLETVSLSSTSRLWRCCAGMAVCAIALFLTKFLFAL